MTGGDGDVSPPAPPHAGMPISGFSAVPSSASSGDVGRSMKRKPALPGGSSVTTLGSSLPPSKRLKGSGVGAKGGLKKTKKTEPDAPHICTRCGKSFNSEQAVYGHMRIHKRKESSETASELDLNKVPEDGGEEAV